MEKSTNRNKEIMYELWGTDRLVTDYGSLESVKNKQMLREINHDEIIPKNHDFKIQNEIHQTIRNDNDYDDWEYGTEPIPHNKW
jgi:hypothetical protein